MKSYSKNIHNLYYSLGLCEKSTTIIGYSHILGYDRITKLWAIVAFTRNKEGDYIITNGDNEMLFDSITDAKTAFIDLVLREYYAL